MTALSQEILDAFQIRKTKKQKTAFIHLLEQHFPDLKIQEGGFPKCRNLILGDIDTAKVILTAHYDTCAQLPFPNFIMPKNPLVSILYSVLLILPLFVAVFLLNLALNFFTTDWWVHYYVSFAAYLGFLILLIAGPANKHTANDNTSGVVVLCELAKALEPTLQKKVAFVFFDHEETGLIGSSYFRAKYKRQMADKLLINFDCVSDGDHILVSANKTARKQYAALLKKAFQPTEEKSILFANAEKVYYPSDQKGFKQSVAIAALKYKKRIGYYMNRIHTSKDTVFERENIKLICESILELLKQM